MTSSAPGPGTLRERKKQRVREEIYNAALDLLAEQPYDKVSVDDICARAQVGRATFFRFYGSKAGRKLQSPVVGITADGAGYLLVTKAGNVYPFHTAFYGSKAGHSLPAPVVGITAAR